MSAPALRSENLGGSLEVRDVAEVRARLMAALDASTALRVEVGAVSTVDTAGAQLLLALELEAVRRGARLEIAGASTALARTLDALGLRLSAWNGLS